MRAFLPPPAGGAPAATGGLLGAPLIVPDVGLTTDEPEVRVPSRTPFPFWEYEARYFDTKDDDYVSPSMDSFDGGRSIRHGMAKPVLGLAHRDLPGACSTITSRQAFVVPRDRH